MNSSKKTMLSAVQPSNRLTIGTYFGALKNWVDLQKEYDCIFFAVDLHAITERQDPEKLREWTYRAIATYIACGIDPDACTLFAQSHVPAHAELAWILTANSYMGEVSRMTQFKDKSAKHGESIPVGLFAYPILMAADILLYQTDLVPVGADQKQHIELARDLAGRMNGILRRKDEPQPHTDPNRPQPGGVFTMPEPYIPKIGARIMSLQDPTKKMSKSDPDPKATVFLDDTDKDIEKKFKGAVTDSGTEIADSDDKPGIRNLLSIQSAITGKSTSELVAAYQGKMYGHLKVDTANLCIETVRPIREKVDQLMADRAYLDSILKRGAEKARERAAKTLSSVYERMGFISAT